uniref:Uncharacterized protein n=1 Tax=Anguilla anguilla TaxID=7936 RepID=A0A0E9VDS0_ANGAN
MRLITSLLHDKSHNQF